VRARRQAVPAIDVDADEDRLEKEGEALDREAEAEHAAEGGGELRPQQPISKLRIVPVITPTANSAAMIRVQRRASVR